LPGIEIPAEPLHPAPFRAILLAALLIFAPGWRINMADLALLLQKRLMRKPFALAFRPSLIMAIEALLRRSLGRRLSSADQQPAKQNRHEPARPIFSKFLEHLELRIKVGYLIDEIIGST
jgi:hypothetical protein